MSRATIILTGEMSRQKAANWCRRLPINTRVEFKESKRTVPQNDRMWAMLTEIAAQVSWHGLKLSRDDWKLLFIAELKGEMRLVPNLSGNGLVNLGRSSSDLTKEEMSNLMILIEKHAAEWDVVFSHRDAA